jgi:hypothetical protein
MRRLAPVLILLLAATHAAAEENTGPLSESKQQLKQLQKDQGARDRAPSGADLKGLMPRIATPGAQSMDLPPPSESTPRLDGKGTPGQKSPNWLLDGYDQLAVASGKSGKSPRSIRDDNRAQDGNVREGGILSSATGQKQESRTDADGRSGGRKTIQSPDPMEPFLKAWLAKSPVKDVILNARDSAKRLDDGQEFSGSQYDLMREDPVSGPVTSTTSTTGDHSFGAKQENPFLQALNAPLPVTAPGVAPSYGLTPAATAEAGKIAPPVIDATVTGPAKNNTFNGPPSQAKDDKKYFPQLKRF